MAPTAPTVASKDHEDPPSWMYFSSGSLPSSFVVAVPLLCLLLLLLLIHLLLLPLPLRFVPPRTRPPPYIPPPPPRASLPTRCPPAPIAALPVIHAVILVISRLVVAIVLTNQWTNSALPVLVRS
eukprot:2672039-Pyramimonas_sp.AAC.1